MAKKVKKVMAKKRAPADLTKRNEQAVKRQIQHSVDMFITANASLKKDLGLQSDLWERAIDRIAKLEQRYTDIEERLTNAESHLPSSIPMETP